MNTKIKNLLVGFKPQFGNSNHIRALEIIQKLEKREKLKKEGSKLPEDPELDYEERNLEFLLKS